MATRHISSRLDAEVYDRLERQSRRAGRKRAELINTYLDEGLRMEEHPGITFRAGPAGRRAALADGPDVWEVIRVVKNTEGSGDNALRQAAEWLGLRGHQVEAAVRYYADYPDEVDGWIARVDEEAERGQAAWDRRQSALA